MIGINAINRPNTNWILNLNANILSYIDFADPDLTGTRPDEGSSLSLIQDRLGFGWLQIAGAQQGIYTSAGLNGHPGVLFDYAQGTSYSTHSLTSPNSNYTIFVVHDPTYWDSDFDSWLLSFSTQTLVVAYANDLSEPSIYDGTTWESFGVINDIQGAQIFELVYDSTNNKANLFINGVQKGGDLAAPLRAITVGTGLGSDINNSASFYSGYLGKSLIVGSALDATTRLFIRRQFANEYGIDIG